MGRALLGCLLLAPLCARAQTNVPVAGTTTSATLDTSAPLTLDQSIQIALRMQGNIGAAQENFVSAQQNVVSARSNYFPQVNANVGYDYFNGSRSVSGFSNTGTGGTTIYRSSTTSATTTGLSVSQNLFDSGRTRAQVRQAQAQTLNAVGGFGNARSTLAYEVATRFYDQLQQEKLVAQYNGQVALAQQQLEQIQAQVEAGVSARVDVQTVQVTLSQARFNLATAQTDLQSAQSNFRNALGLGIGGPLRLQESALSQQVAPVVVPAPISATGDAATNPVLESSSANAAIASTTPTSTTPSVVNATPAIVTVPSTPAPNVTASASSMPAPNAVSTPSQNSSSASATPTSTPSTASTTTATTVAASTPIPTATPMPIATATPEALPELPELASLDSYLAEARRLRPDLVQARATVQSSEAAVSLAKIAERPQITATAGYNIDPRTTQDRGLTVSAGLSIPIFDAGGRRADVRAAQATLTGNQIRLAQTDKDVASDVQTAYVAISGQVARISNARDLVQSAQINLETAIERYRLGLGIVLDVVNAQTQLFSAQTSATQAVFDYELSLANLDRAVGRFAWADPNQAPPAQAPTTIPTAIAVPNATLVSDVNAAKNH